MMTCTHAKNYDAFRCVTAFSFIVGVLSWWSHGHVNGQKAGVLRCRQLNARDEHAAMQRSSSYAYCVA
jgi:hypothetical protein